MDNVQVEAEHIIKLEEIKEECGGDRGDKEECGGEEETQWNSVDLGESITVGGLVKEEYDADEEELKPALSVWVEPNEDAEQIKQEEEAFLLHFEEEGTYEEQNEGEEPEYQNEDTPHGMQSNASVRDVPVSQRKKQRKLIQDIEGVQKQIIETFQKLNTALSTKDNDCDLYGKLLAQKLRLLLIQERHLIMHEFDGILLKRTSHFTIYSCSSYFPSPSPIHPQSTIAIRIPNEPSFPSDSNATLQPHMPLSANIPYQPSSSNHVFIPSLSLRRYTIVFNISSDTPVSQSIHLKAVKNADSHESSFK